MNIRTCCKLNCSSFSHLLCCLCCWVSPYQKKNYSVVNGWIYIHYRVWCHLKKTGFIVLCLLSGLYQNTYFFTVCCTLQPQNFRLERSGKSFCPLVVWAVLGYFIVIATQTGRSDDFIFNNQTGVKTKNREVEVEEGIQYPQWQ